MLADHAIALPNPATGLLINNTGALIDAEVVAYDAASFLNAGIKLAMQLLDTQVFCFPNYTRVRS